MDTVWEIGLCFFIYAFLGWCVEVIFHAVTFGKFINRGFLNGPVCPIYGFGAVGVIMALTPISQNLPLLYAASMALTSALEWITGFTLEKLFHAKWWDYTDEPFNLNGYVCLRFSLLWGVACVLVMRIVHPAVLSAVNSMPFPLYWVLLVMLCALTLLDLAATLAQIRKLTKHLKVLTDLGKEIHGMSDGIGAVIAETAMATKEKAEASKEILAEKKDDLTDRLADTKADLSDRLAETKAGFTNMISETREGVSGVISETKSALSRAVEQKRQQLEEKLQAFSGATDIQHLGMKRLIRAFPDLKSIDYQEALDKLRDVVGMRK